MRKRRNTLQSRTIAVRGALGAPVDLHVPAESYRAVCFCCEREFEHRLGKRGVHSQQLKQVGMRIADFPVGAPNRTSALIRDIVEGNWISNCRINPKINPDVAFKHLFPRANALMTNRSSLDFAGQVHNLQ